MIGKKEQSFEIKTAPDIGLAIVGLTAVNSAFVLLSGIGVNGEHPYSKCPTIAKPFSLAAIIVPCIASSFFITKL